ncbi:MAG: hypothetical protein MR851_09880 [[Clostridium] scindens]|uniref:hypothetical protein n=1 Tax=Clostridium scindens (strain JCM 10418 / VPI 12708) TaxID=29347 RepID=UPI00242A7BA2|nr:hypothetical protein [[Clostridium] scindens]MCI6396525.1 hypothetical protein [[Clostridium] scindens]MDY4866277.1 hypothetical protein [[Clostridium] scindens]
MIINIPDEIFERELKNAFREMPPTNNTNPKNRMKSSPVLYQIGYALCLTEDFCVTMTMIYKKIFSELKNREIIIYNFQTDTWQGVDYNGD